MKAVRMMIDPLRLAHFINIFISVVASSVAWEGGFAEVKVVDGLGEIKRSTASSKGEQEVAPTQLSDFVYSQKTAARKYNFLGKLNDIQGYCFYSSQGCSARIESCVCFQMPHKQKISVPLHMPEAAGLHRLTL